ncbi:hypothetical protein SESBI_05715 [Sesbania bispinosa]|nr:hypothetical protein SESBI_05715 [Sesbania bispinosa]
MKQRFLIPLKLSGCSSCNLLNLELGTNCLLQKLLSFNIAESLPSIEHSLDIIMVLKTAREAVQFGLAGSALGAVFTAGFAWKYSRSLHGTGLSFLAGGVFGWTFGQEIANHALQLYRVDTLAAEAKFLDWWKWKTEGGH